MRGISRRMVLATLPAVCSIPWLSAITAEINSESSLYPEFPAQNPERVKEMVGVCHGNTEKVRMLLDESPALAKATWDWGYGDWETGLGAASHTGSREIARMLMEKGARPDIFTFAMLGMIDVVKAYVTTSSGIQRIKGPHGLSLLHHARQGGKEAENVVAYLEQVGDADIRVSSLSLSDEEKQRYIGTYRLGPGSGSALEVFAGKTGFLNIKKGTDGVSRTIYHLGNHEFHPVGAESVRIRFGVTDGRSMNLSVVDGPFLLMAERV